MLAVEALKATPGNFINLKERATSVDKAVRTKYKNLTTPFLIITTSKYQTIAKFTTKHKIPNTY